MNVINKIMRGDKVIWIVALLLGIVSLIVVYSASSALAVNNFGGNNGRVLMKHAGTLLIGFAMMFGIYLINYKHYAKAAWLLLIPCLALLAYTLLFGRNINSASRSINIGFFSFQPSEVAKIILITYLARQLVMMGDHLHNFKDVILWLGLPILFTVALIFPENLSTAAILLLVSLVVLFLTLAHGLDAVDPSGDTGLFRYERLGVGRVFSQGFLRMFVCDVGPDGVNTDI